MKESLEIIDQFYNLKARYSIRIPQIFDRTLADLEALRERIDHAELATASIPVLDKCRQEIDQMLHESGAFGQAIASK